MKIHYLQHVPFERLGYIENVLTKMGHHISGTCFFNGDALPDLHAIDALIIMGGPMGVYDEAQYPWLRAEKDFIRRCIDQGKKVLGICLGAQLIAAALGATVRKAPHKEIGWYPVALTPAANALPWVHTWFSNNPTVFHWHGDRFDIPGAETHNLLSSTANDNQAYCYNEHVIGLQFHLEVNEALVHDMLHHGADDLTPAAYVQTAVEIKNNLPLHVAHCNRIMAAVLNNWLTPSHK
jgi:GMP synthase-like glutamine amidotransferase